jgi:hypothetical protein
VPISAQHHGFLRREDAGADPTRKGVLQSVEVASRRLPSDRIGPRETPFEEVAWTWDGETGQGPATLCNAALAAGRSRDRKPRYSAIPEAIRGRVGDYTLANEFGSVD